jgi:hypothetical protein
MDVIHHEMDDERGGYEVETRYLSRSGQAFCLPYTARCAVAGRYAGAKQAIARLSVETDGITRVPPYVRNHHFS